MCLFFHFIQMQSICMILWLVFIFQNYILLVSNIFMQASIVLSFLLPYNILLYKMLPLLILFLMQLEKIVIFMIVNSMSPFTLFNKVYKFVPKGFLYHLLDLLLYTPYFLFLLEKDWCWQDIKTCFENVRIYRKDCWHVLIFLLIGYLSSFINPNS